MAAGGAAGIAVAVVAYICIARLRAKVERPPPDRVHLPLSIGKKVDRPAPPGIQMASTAWDPVAPQSSTPRRTSVSI